MASIWVRGSFHTLRDTVHALKAADLRGREDLPKDLKRFRLRAGQVKTTWMLQTPEDKNACGSLPG
jgi:hypothetical protein